MYQYLINSLAFAHTGLIRTKYPQRRPLGYFIACQGSCFFSKGKLWTSLLINNYLIVKVLFLLIVDYYNCYPDIIIHFFEHASDLV